MFTPVTNLKYSIDRWLLPPTPAEPKLTLPGLAFAYCRNSFSVPGSDGCTTMNCGCVPTSITGAKSFSGSNGGFFAIIDRGDEADVVEEEGIAVGRRLRYELRAQRAACARPRLDHTGCPHASVSFAPMAARLRFGAAARRERIDDADRARRISRRPSHCTR
jgi:hypothetical protein